jgi:hypothetical protein
MSKLLRKRPCRFCRRWFLPDPRIGDRQRACSQGPCQAARRIETQASWRRRNPDYFAARRLLARVGSGERDCEPPRLPPPLNRLPWDLAQDQFTAQGADFLGQMGRLLVAHAQDQRAMDLVDST